jgi:hypothetical protein
LGSSLLASQCRVSNEVCRPKLVDIRGHAQIGKVLKHLQRERPIAVSNAIFQCSNTLVILEALDGIQILELALFLAAVCCARRR